MELSDDGSLELQFDLKAAEGSIHDKLPLLKYIFMSLLF